MTQKALHFSPEGLEVLTRRLMPCNEHHICSRQPLAVGPERLPKPTLHLIALDRIAHFSAHRQAKPRRLPTVVIPEHDKVAACSSATQSLHPLEIRASAKTQRARPAAATVARAGGGQGLDPAPSGACWAC